MAHAGGDHRRNKEEDLLPITSQYLFVTNMDVDKDKEGLFNKVYDTEHIPHLLTPSLAPPPAATPCRLLRRFGGTAAPPKRPGARRRAAQRGLDTRRRTG